MVDEWEALRRDSASHLVYTPTSDVLERLDEQVNDVLGVVQTSEDESIRARTMLPNWF